MNDVPANGATIIGAGPVIAGGVVLVGSGYANFGGRAGNVLFAFVVD